MSPLTARQTRRRELILPLALLIVYTVCFGLYSLHRETKEGVEHARQDARRKVAVEMTHLQEFLNYLLQKGDLAAMRESLSSLGYNPLLRVGLLVDDQQIVLASTRLALIGHPAGEVWPEVEQPENVRWRQQALKHMQGVVEVSADGKSIIGHYPVPLSIGQVPRRVGYLFFEHDLTELEKASRYTAERSVLRSMVMLLVIAGGMGLIVYVLLGQRIQRLVTATEGMAEQIGRSREQLRENEERFRALMDEHKHLQEKLQTADRMASIGALASGVAHEINNPLSFTLSNLRFVRDEFKELPEGWDALAKEQLKEIQEALGESLEGGERVNEIVQDLRRFARGDDGKRAPVNLHAVLDLCGNIARSQLKHRAQLVKAYGELPPVHANESRLGQLFLNLIVNAAQAIPEGGDAKAHEVRITTWREGADQVVVEVKDTGVGIPPENLHRLFDPFFTTKPAGVGTGLGLSISLDIVKAMGGRITVDSEPGKGTAFRVFLPVGEAGAAPAGESRGGQRS